MIYIFKCINHTYRQVIAFCFAKKTVKILFPASIIAIANYIDEMVDDRPYRNVLIVLECETDTCHLFI